MVNECEFPYGRRFLKARFPERSKVTVLKSHYAKGLEDPEAAIRGSLRSPIGSPPLSECLRKGDKVVVIVTDNTRACPDDKLLPPLLAEIENRVPSDNITIIVALGLHAPLSQSELVTKLGRRIMDKYLVVNHDANDTVNLGVTSKGLPVEINRQVIEADFRISTGFIEPHFFAGFSGGSKSITPGVASAKTIRANHSYEMINHPNSRAGILKTNPIHEDIVEQGKMARLNFILNVLLNEKREITHVVAGDPVLAHERGCEIERDLAGILVDHKFDIVITTNSGAPLDLDFYQTCKGIENAALITRDGGAIVVAAACGSGLGPETFYTLHASATTPQEVLKRIKNKGAFGVQWQNQILARVQVNKKVYLVSSLDDSLVKRMMVTPVPTIEVGLEKALEDLGEDAEIAVIPEGPLTLPILKD